MRFFYLRPDVLGLAGFVYACGDQVVEGQIEVTLVKSGRWRELEEEHIKTVPADEATRREVTEGEALSGVGTYVGSCVCVARRSETSAERWDYGVVSGYRWRQSGILQVVSRDGSFEAGFEKEYLQELAAETYAMRLCTGTALAALMPAEMRARHEKAYNAFHGVGCGALRSLAAICRRVGQPEVSEAGCVPLMELTSLDVVQVAVSYILDFEFYMANPRRKPATLQLGPTIFDDPASASGANEQAARGSASRPILAADDSLSSSDDESDEGFQGELAGLQPQPRSKHKRTADDRTDDRPRARRRATTTQHREPLTMPAAALLTPSDGRGQFRPSTLQSTVHQSIVTGTYALMDGQLFVERLQSQHRLVTFLPHPAILKGLYAWEFGARGLSIMHFQYADVATRRRLVRQTDMCDFSGKNPLPAAPRPSCISSIIEALDALATLTNEIYAASVGQVLAVARRFFLQLKARGGSDDALAVEELAAWCDDRLESFRSHLISGSDSASTDVIQEFSVSHEAYVDATTAIANARFQRLEQVSQAQYSRHSQSGPRKEAGDRHGHRTAATTRVPTEVLEALPIQDGKRLCMKYLANQSCRSKSDACHFPDRGHFRPIRLPGKVKQYIDQYLGGLKPEFQTL